MALAGDLERYPRKYGKYHLLGSVTRGGAGALHLAINGSLAQPMVIKTVVPQLADPEYIARFREEAAVLVKLSHPNLVRVLDAGLVLDELFLAMDLVEGRDLRAVWNRCAKKQIGFPIDIAVYVVKELCRGLDYAHNFGETSLVHRDISPPNIVIAYSGDVKLADFGLTSSTLRLDKTTNPGNVAYMSPEQARGEPLDSRSDLYAAGIVLWELLTGRQLFPATKDHPPVSPARNPEVMRPSKRAPRVPAGLDEICMRALGAAKHARYATADDMRLALESWLAVNAPATDGTRVAAFVGELFSDDIARERTERSELFSRVHSRAMTMPPTDELRQLIEQSGTGHAPRKYDIVLKNGRIIDPAKQMDRVADVAILDGKIAAIEENIDPKRSRRVINVAGLLVCPGLIDLHVHCNLYRNPESLDPTAAGVYTGVTRMVDPGDSGVYTFQSFRKAIIQNTPTRIHSWLNAAGLGGFMYGLYNTDAILHHSMIDIEASVELARIHPEYIAGIKTYCAPEGWGSSDGTEIYTRALKIAELAGIPMYIHSGSPSPEGYQAYGGTPMLFGKEVTREEALTTMLEMLRPGDVVAHPFSTFFGTAWNSVENRISRGVKEAYARGVHFDSGRGAHYSYNCVRNLMNAGVLPNTLSSDRHAEDNKDEFIRKASVGLCQHMSEFLAFGMSLNDVIMRATLNPAKVLRVQDRAGSLHIGKPAEISVLALREGDWTLCDAPFFGKEPNKLKAKQLLTAVMTLVDNKVFPVNPAFLPDLQELQVQEDVWSWMSERPKHHTAYEPVK